MIESTFLVCGFPRSRTLWLSQFLTIPGYSLCNHEATENSASAEEFWARAQVCEAGTKVYGNSDSANIFVLPSLLALRPLTTVIWISRPVMDVLRSMKNAGIPCSQNVMEIMLALRDKHWECFDAVFDYDALCYHEVCEMVWELCLPGLPFDYERWQEYNKMRICYSRENPYPDKNPAKFLTWLDREATEEKECAS